MKTTGYFLCALFMFAAACGSPRYAVRLDNARSLVAQGEYDTAEAALRGLIRTNPDDPEPYRLLGMLSAETAEYTDAVGYFEKAVELGAVPDDGTYLRWGESLYALGDTAAARACFERAVDAGAVTEGSRYQGLIAYEGGEYDAAAQLLRRAVRNVSADSMVYYYLGMSFYRTGRYGDAADALSRAHEYMPGNHEVALLAGSMHHLNGTGGQAAALYRTIPRSSTYFPEARYNLAAVEIDAGDYQEAAEHLLDFLGSRPDDFGGLFNLASVYIETGNNEEALDILTGLHERDPGNVRVAYNLGMANRAQGRIDQALAHLRFAAEREPDTPRYRYLYGLALDDAGLEEEAAAQMRTVERLDPGHIGADRWLELYGTVSE